MDTKIPTCSAPTTSSDGRHGSLIQTPAQWRNGPPSKKLAGNFLMIVFGLKLAVISYGVCR
ncbi:unnamed protein product [Thlaspi arvense]|uniref:Uncharacterized protein n=1 Tax=Thlaspi arvense TaxID=13288 RepID=A0AAU9SKA4_THLAR|nr:unnamed protein product [Thlaspi arvense]